MAVPMQSYTPYRTTLLSKEDLRELQRLRPWHVLSDTFLGWLGILCAWGLVAVFPHWYVVALAIPVIGTRYYSLLIVGHDGLHRRLFDSPKASDLWNDLFIVGPVGAVTHLNRRNHMRHHAQLATDRDPDRYKYVNANKASRTAFLLVLTGLPYVYRAVRNIFFEAGSAAGRTSTADESARGEGYLLRDIAIVVGWQVLLVGGLTYFIGWWAYPLLWLLPVYAFAFVADLVRVFCEHSVLDDDREADRAMRLVSFASGPVERQFFAPHNMNCHIAHHLWPGIPYYNLPEAERRLKRAAASQGGGLAWRPSYLKHLVDYWRWLGQPRHAVDGVQVR